MTAKKWFFLINNEVKGPFPESEVHSLVQKHADGLVWGQGLSEWVTPDIWKKTLSDLQDILSSLQMDMTPQWKIRQGDFEAGPFVYDQMIQVLKAHPNAGDVDLFHEGEEGWKGIYSFPTIVEEVGITRRSHQRVPISGIFRYEKEGATFDSLLSSISEGGIGILEAQGLSIGDVIKGTIQSPQLPTPLTCTCEAMYRQDDSSWGLKFQNLTLESKSLIVSYTQKFAKASASDT
jgi:hypothetical protein